MKRILTFLTLTMSLWVLQAETPKLFTERAFNSVSLVDAANHFVAIGEDATAKEFQELLANDATNNTWIFSKGMDVGERIGWICRILYEPQGKSPLRAPKYGKLDLPESTIPLSKWPLYPVVLSGSTYFVLGEKYSTDRVPENPGHYIAYCRANGVFRKTAIQPSTREQAMKDATALRQSKSWQDIQWIDETGTSYLIGEQLTWAFLQNQGKSISDVAIVKNHSKIAPVASTKTAPSIVSIQ